MEVKTIISKRTLNRGNRAAKWLTNVAITMGILEVTLMAVLPSGAPHEVYHWLL